MKKIILITQALFVVFIATSQEVKTVNVEKEKFNLLQEMSLTDQFLEPKFLMGKVVFKNGKTASQYLNYNIVANGITFLDEQNKVFILEGLADILMISFGNRNFVPINNVEVVEVLESFANGSSLVLQRQAKIKSDFENRGAYGTSTEAATAVSRHKTLTYDGITYGFDKHVEINITLKTNYLLTIDGKRYPLKNFSSLKKHYPTKWDDVKKYAKDQNFDFKNPENVLSIVRFCNN
jgi:hypothetical protein